MGYKTKSLKNYEEEREIYHSDNLINWEEYTMKWKELFNRWGLTNIRLNLQFAEIEFNVCPEDEIAAWEMYVELITRVTTQKLLEDDGDEKTALDSIYSLFGVTRDILKRHGINGQSFAKITIIVLNQIIRPFTAKWHRINIKNGFKEKSICKDFRKELELLRGELVKYSKLLADLAKVEDITYIGG